MKYLIVNADDFGRNAGNVRATIRCHAEGVVTSTSMFAVMPDFEQSVAALLERPDLGVGVHLTFSGGQPVSNPTDIPTLINPDTNGFYASDQLTSDRLARFDPAHLYCEFKAQFNRVRTHGLEPTHIDNHRVEVYLIPQLFEVAMQLAGELKVPIRMPFDARFEASVGHHAAQFGIAKEVALRLAANYRKRSQQLGILHTDSFLAVSPSTCSLDGVIRLLGTLEDGTTEICTHPGDNAVEADIWCHASLRAALERSGIELRNFRTAFSSRP